MYSWIVVGLLTAILYFYNWNTTANRGIPYAIHNPIESFKFYVFALGDILGASISDSPHGAQYAVFAFGLVILGMGIWAIVSSGLRVDQSSGRPVGVALVLDRAALRRGHRRWPGLGGAEQRRRLQVCDLRPPRRRRLLPGRHGTAWRSMIP